MTTADRDKFLTEAMGDCAHSNLESFKSGGQIFTRSQCADCGKFMEDHDWLVDFSTWQGFGKLWKWAMNQDWFYVMMVCNKCGPVDIVNPELFANEVYKYLTSEETR